MPRKADPVQVGRTQCPTCPARIPVFVNARGYFYTKCAECGTDQRNGAPVQTRLYYETDWLGDPPPRPRNVPETPPASEDPPPAPEQPERSRSTAQHKDVPPSGDQGNEPPPAETDSTGSTLKFFGVLGTIVLAAIGLGNLQ